MPVGACTVSTVCECECGKRILGVNSSRAHDDDDEWTLMHSFTRASSNNIHPLGSTRRPGDSTHCISWMYVCACTRVCVCVHVCVCVCARARACACVSLSLPPFLSVCLSVFLSAHACLRVRACVRRVVLCWVDRATRIKGVRLHYHTTCRTHSHTVRAPTWARHTNTRSV